MTSAEKDAPTRSRWTPGHLDGCRQYPTGWLCDVACRVPASECVIPPGKPSDRGAA